MFELKLSDRSTMQKETDACFKMFENIKIFFDLQSELYNIDRNLCFGDCQIDAIAYNSKKRILTIRIVDTTKDENNKLNMVFYVFDFYGVEDFWCDIAPEHYINDLFMQKTDSGRILFECDGGLKFSFVRAEANRWWKENKTL